MSHHYAQRGRPLHAHAMGRIGEWAPRASRVPNLVNGLMGLSGFSGALRKIAGMASQRPLPRLAQRSLRAQLETIHRARRDPSRTAGRRRGDPLVLFPDTFSNYFRPQGALAAVRVLEDSGARVDLPRERLCCGRPYYDFGMLDRAKAALANVLRVLKPQIESGTPVVVLEPGCHSVFRDELLKLFPGDENAARLARQTVTLAEALQARHWKPRPVGGQALLHGHCHQKAFGGTRADVALLEAAGIETSAPDLGCCGMAGSFGFRAETYATSVKIANLSVLPKVKQAAPASFIVANGFSCREQIEDLGGRETLHLAEVLARGLG